MSVFDTPTYNLNSGVALYFVNSSSQAAWVRGGMTPVMGCHSVMLNPDSVKRVTPPTTMIPMTSVEDIMSHIPTDLGASIGGGLAVEGGVFNGTFLEVVPISCIVAFSEA